MQIDVSLQAMGAMKKITDSRKLILIFLQKNLKLKSMESKLVNKESQEDRRLINCKKQKGFLGDEFEELLQGA